MQQAIISVSHHKSVYRHIAIPITATLYTLAEAILWSFDFMNDHAHVFFMDNKLSWGDTSSAIYCPEIDEGVLDDGELVKGITTDQVRLNSIGSVIGLPLVKGRKFKFVFDFGDEHIFQCSVLRIEEYEEEEDIAEIEALAPEHPAHPELSEHPAHPELSEHPAHPELSEHTAHPELSEHTAHPELSEHTAHPELSEHTERNSVLNMNHRLTSRNGSYDKVADALFEVDYDDSIEIDGFEIRIVKSVGESPLQYPEYDEDE